MPEIVDLVNDVASDTMDGVMQKVRESAERQMGMPQEGPRQAAGGGRSLGSDQVRPETAEKADMVMREVADVRDDVVEDFRPEILDRVIPEVYDDFGQVAEAVGGEGLKERVVEEFVPEIVDRIVPEVLEMSGEVAERGAFEMKRRLVGKMTGKDIADLFDTDMPDGYDEEADGPFCAMGALPPDIARFIGWIDGGGPERLMRGGSSSGFSYSTGSSSSSVTRDMPGVGPVTVTRRSVMRPQVNVWAKGGKAVERQLDAPEIEESLQKNLIPEGALHKQRHHMDMGDDVTKKGIPVMDIKEDNGQEAEIERNEIIFNKEVTEKLEELYKVYYDDNSSAKEKDEAAIDAGKLLTKEIMLNTDDRTGLIDTLKKGGSLKSQTDKPPVKKTEVVGAGPAGFEWMVDMTEKPSYEEWVKDVNPGYMSDNYDLKKAFEVLPFAELQRWKKVIGTPLENQLPVETWHLPSVWFDRDNDVGVFLKKGQTVEENPELQGEFDAYNSNPEMQKEWKMVYDPEEGRWMYVRR